MSEDNKNKLVDIEAGKERFAVIYEELKKPFPNEALSKDSSRGFDLTSVKAQYIVERLNEVLIAEKRGGYEFVGDFEKVEGGILYHGKLIINDGHRGQSQCAVGFSANKKNVGDAYKGAMTDALSKAASKFGVANEVFKGNVKPPGSAPKKPAKVSAIKKPAVASNDDF